MPLLQPLRGVAPLLVPPASCRWLFLATSWQIMCHVLLSRWRETLEMMVNLTTKPLELRQYHLDKCLMILQLHLQLVSRESRSAPLNPISPLLAISVPLNPISPPVAMSAPLNLLSPPATAQCHCIRGSLNWPHTSQLAVLHSALSSLQKSLPMEGQTPSFMWRTSSTPCPQSRPVGAPQNPTAGQAGMHHSLCRSSTHQWECSPCRPSVCCHS